MSRPTLTLPTTLANSHTASCSQSFVPVKPFTVRGQPSILMQYHRDGTDGRDCWVPAKPVRSDVRRAEPPTTSETQRYWHSVLQKPEARGRFAPFQEASARRSAHHSRVPLVPHAARFPKLQLPALPRTCIAHSARNNVEQANSTLADKLAQVFRDLK